ncbi:MAG: DUF411 domain-containing protein [Acetobacteraceae bacterium]|nr:DUF411 domain-containing protein [Acetobacteraceae bacterium]
MPDLRRRAMILSLVPAFFGSAAAASLPQLRVFKNAGCTCCDGWLAHLRAAGFSASVTEADTLIPVRRAARVPDELAGCHTAFADALVLEGHVPLAAVMAFLREPRQWRGIAVPAMPLGSPGMEVPGQPPEPYTIWAFDAAGGRAAYADALGPDVRFRPPG